MKFSKEEDKTNCCLNIIIQQHIAAQSDQGFLEHEIERVEVQVQLVIAKVSVILGVIAWV